MTSITKAKDFKKSNVVLTKPTDNKGIRMSWVKNEGKSLLFQVSAPIHYGVSDFEGNQKFSLTIALNPSNEKHKDFINACNALKEGVLERIGESWKDFGLKTSSDVETIKSKFYNIIKVPDDSSESSNQLLKLNVMKKKESDDFDITMYNNDNKVLESVDAKSHLRRGATITAVISVQSVWVNSKKEAGVKLKLQRARIDESAPESGSAKPFDDMDEDDTVAAGGAGVSSKTTKTKFAAAVDEDDEDDVLVDAPAAGGAGASAPAKTIDHIDEDDEDDELGEVVQPPPVPKKESKPVKKVIKKSS
jgi:hypothetical protein